MMDAWISLDDAMIIIHRLTDTLFRSVVAGDQFREQLRESLNNPQPLDWVMICNSRSLNQPAALQIGQLVMHTPAKEEGQPCLHTVKLLDGTITTWKNQHVIKIPTAVFNMKSQPMAVCDSPS